MKEEYVGDFNPIWISSLLGLFNLDLEFSKTNLVVENFVQIFAKTPSEKFVLFWVQVLDLVKYLKHKYIIL